MVLYTRTTTNQATLLSNKFHSNPLSLHEDSEVACTFKRNSKYITDKLLGIDLMKFCSSQALIICNRINKWPTSDQITCIHGLDSSVVDYVIFDTHVIKCIVNIDLLTNCEPDFDYKSLTLTLNLYMQTNDM